MAGRRTAPRGHPGRTSPRCCRPRFGTRRQLCTALRLRWPNSDRRWAPACINHLSKVEREDYALTLARVQGLIPRREDRFPHPE